MGLDQSFYKEKPKVDKDGYLDLETKEEVLYFRKFHDLHAKISDIVGGAGNAEVIRLQPNDLKKLVNFIVENHNLYWAYDSEDDELPETLFKAIGILTYYAKKSKPLFYVGDW
jgi:hypothetical protein